MSLPYRCSHAETPLQKFPRVSSLEPVPAKRGCCFVRLVGAQGECKANPWRPMPKKAEGMSGVTPHAKSRGQETNSAVYGPADSPADYIATSCKSQPYPAFIQICLRAVLLFR